jgi:prepilin-type N-terminal cleavage/methylation domain-containing protein
MPRVSRKTSASPLAPRGFSLIEILVVVMVILVIAAISIPHMLQARMRANEAAAVASMHVINTAENVYTNAYPQVGFTGKLADLGNRGGDCRSPSTHNSCIIMDEALTDGLKSGYAFALVGDGTVPQLGYTLTATPQSAGVSGRCTYTSDQNGQVQVASVHLSAPVRFTLSTDTACSPL